MHFDVMLNGEPVRVPSPEQMPPVGLMAQAMRNLRIHPPVSGVTRIECGRPRADLGTLSLVKGPRLPRLQLDTGEESSLVPERCCHIALMRPAELVVTYVERGEIPSDMVEFAGVFVCDEEVEQHFADSEPPAHDDWLFESLQDPGRRFVRTALRQIRQTADEFATPLAASSERQPQTSLAQVADLVGGVVIGQDGGGLGGGKERPRAASRRRNGAPKVVQISEPESFRLAMVHKTPCALFRVVLSVPEGTTLRVQAEPLVVMDGGTTSAPTGDATRVVAWLDEKGDPITEGADAEFTGPGEFAPLVAVSVSPDSAVSVSIRAGKGDS